MTMTKKTGQRAGAGQGIVLGCLLGVVVALWACPALALEELPGEAEALKACEKKFCTMVLKKEPAGEDLACNLTKTWAQDTIKGGEKKSVKWGFGDARCSVSVKMSRAEVIQALTKPAHTVVLKDQAVRCVVERDGEQKPVTAKASPKLQFKGGRAEKVWINLEDLSGPADVKSTVWTAAQLEDTLGIFHKNMIKQINKFMYKKCSENHGPGAVAKALKDLQKAKAAAAKAESAKAQPAKAEAAKAAAPADAKGATKPAAEAKPAADAKTDAKTVAKPVASPPAAPEDKAAAPAPAAPAKTATP